MTGQQLRNSILQEAIQGRLVPNVLQPGEKTGEELLKSILAEHQKKENEEKGKKAKKLTLSTIEEEPWELPEGWCWTPLSSIVDILNGYAFKSALYVNEGYRVIRITNVQDGQIVDNEPKYYPISQKEIITDYFLKEGDLLMSLTGNVGRVGILNKDLLPAALNQRVACLRLHKEETATRQYLFWFFRSQFFLNECTNSSKGMAQLNMSTEWLKQFSIPFPPLSIQKAIVEKIEELLPLIDEYGKAAVELETLNKILPDKLRKSVLQEAIHGTLVPNDISEGEATGAELLQQILKERQEKENKEKGKKAKKLTLSTIEEEPWELPEGWCWARLGDVMTFVNGRAYKKEELLSSGKYKVLRVGNFFTNDSWYYSDLELPDEKYCCKGDLLYAWSASFGPWIWEGDKTIFHYHIWNVKFNEDKLCKKYLYWFFEADKHIIKESTTGSTMIHVSMENMMPRLIPIPPLSIQLRIVEKIEEVFSAINTL